MSTRKRILALVCSGLLLTSCGHPAGTLFPPTAAPIVWPAPPERARIRYVGQLATSADLKPAVGGLEALGTALFGKKDVHTMLTPYAICTDGGDRLFVADSNAQFVHVFNLKTREYAQWHPGDPKKGRFAQPVGIAFDPATHRLFVADSVAGTVYFFDADTGRHIGQTTPGLLNRPTGLYFDTRADAGATGRLFVVDTANHNVSILTPDGRRLGTFGGRGTGPGQFNYPTSVTVDSQGRVYVCDSLNFRVQQFSPDLRPIKSIGKKGDLPGYLSTPKAIATDVDDHLYVVDANFENVQIFDADGRFLLDFGQEGHGPGEFWLPAGIFMDPHQRLWIADTYNRRVQCFDYLSEGKQ